MRSIFCRALFVVLVAGSLQGCKESGPATPAEITAFCAEFTRIASGPDPCNTMAMELARLADDKPRVRMKNLDELLRRGNFKPEERSAYEGCNSAILVVNQKCPGKTGPATALRAIRGDPSPGGKSAEAWVKKGNREDSGNELMGKALQ